MLATLGATASKSQQAGKKNEVIISRPDGPLTCCDQQQQHQVIVIIQTNRPNFYQKDLNEKFPVCGAAENRDQR